MFMQSVTYLLLLVMSAHGIFGCCWHHMHTCDADACEAEVASHEDHHPGETHDEARHLQAEDSVSTQEPCHDDEGCGEEKCVFVRALQADGQFQVAFDLALDHVVYSEVQLPTVSASVSATLSRIDRLAQTTGERCAHLQTWLI